ncbi:class I SAM-dependent methyltransferase [Alicyclobacillus fodiniaquatilis]|uniref:Class I SAM-dependent methyltransferase n=1 Tax=Alicyclobacillus fodiniaquatilis TaxID=1661150 RepID=A0ABW4JL25_9BACL
MQEEMTRANKVAWNTKAYDAWVRHYGTPVKLAEELKQKHRELLHLWLKYIGDPAEKRVLNLLGSTGRRAISLAMLGADVTVVDISQESKLYATETAFHAGVHLNYIAADVLNIPNEDTLGTFDIVLMEFGILHYFMDLNSIFSVVNRRLKQGGRLILTDFHPFSRLLVSTRNLPNPSGIYFRDAIVEGEVAFAKLLPEEDRSGLGKVLIRSWTVGEILTSIASQGLFIRTFEEIRNSENPNLPEFYTLIADKMEVQLPPLYF